MKYIYNIQIQEHSEADGELTQDAHTINCWADKGWELVNVSGLVKTGRGDAFIFYFRKPLADGAVNPILEDQRHSLRGENADIPEELEE